MFRKINREVRSVIFLFLITAFISLFKVLGEETRRRMINMSVK